MQRAVSAQGCNQVFLDMFQAGYNRTLIFSSLYSSRLLGLTEAQESVPRDSEFAGQVSFP